MGPANEAEYPMELEDGPGKDNEPLLGLAAEVPQPEDRPMYYNLISGMIATGLLNANSNDRRHCCNCAKWYLDGRFFPPSPLIAMASTNNYSSH